MPRIRLRMPRTMTGLVVAGMMLAATPLLLAVVLAGISLDRLTSHTERLVSEGVNVARLGTELRDQVSDLERNAEQYLALGDPDMLVVIGERFDKTRDLVDSVDAREFQPALAGHVVAVRQRLAEANQAWNDSVLKGAPLTRALDSIHALGADSAAIIDLGRADMEAELKQLQEASTVARRVIFFSAVALVPLCALFALGFSVVVTRPLRSLAETIGNLGHARYDRPVVIRYPHEIQLLGEQLNWLRRRLGQLEADKDRFLQHVSHELKTPLSSMREGARLLREGSLGPLEPRQAEVAQILVDAASDLSDRIAQLLAYAEWREQWKHIDKQWFEAGALVEEVLDAQRLVMSQRALTAELDLRAARLYGQRSQLRVALDNLVANAVRHAPRGTAIGIHAAVGDRFCELWVRDRGSGVREPEKAKIFEPFVRSPAEEPGIQSSGLGLSIVKETVMAHGGTVEVEDAQPGARFRLVWPWP